MLERLEHRGPDDQGWLGYDRSCTRFGQGLPDDAPLQVMFLHRRLTILDLTTAGRQPMSSSDGRFHLVFNGEIYNYLELRGELEAAGLKFHTRTDTEVLLAALAHWGPSALTRLVGMFALALLDTRERTVFLARDFFGIKPLYYLRDSGRLIFASEIKALLTVPGLRRRVRPEAMYDYLAFSLTDHGSETMLEGIHQIPPAHCLRVDIDRPAEGDPQKYWSLEPSATVDISFPEAARHLRELFLQSVQWHLRSDVAVGSALSGGVDSSGIVAATRQLAGPNVDCHSFTFVTSEVRIDEERWADMAASAAGMTVHKVRIEPEELRDDLDDLIATQDEPFPSTSLYAQYRVFRLAHEAGIKVLLDGQGSDELFGGYSGYLYPRMLSILRSGNLPRAIRFARTAATRPGIHWHRLMGSAGVELLPGLLQGPARRWTARGRPRHWLNADWFRERGVRPREADMASFWKGVRPALLEAVSKVSLPRLLRHEDRSSMAFSLESRVPFLTPAIAQFALSLPEEYLIGDDGTSKRVLRAALRGLVPDPILDRKDKVGFETPEHGWLRALEPWVQRILHSDAAAAIPVVRHDVMRAHAAGMLSARGSFDSCVWRWLNLVRWSELLGMEY